MENKRFIAAEKKKSGQYNCAQAILCTYCDKAGISEEMAHHLGNAFGTGMGNMEGTCGAIVGAGIVLGLIHKERAQSIKDMRLLMEKFQKRNGATQCKLLKGIETKQVLRECPDCVADAAEFLEDALYQK